MRKNLPITQQEYLLPEGMTIVSCTDLKGRITYVNPDFLTASGFDLDELIGKAHNVVRHPDMPEEAFADLWRTLQAGRPWTGMVKNRCKNGDHYWVVANATPLLERGAVTGYMSVRTRPTREQVAEAEAVYRRFQAGRAEGLAIEEGRVVQRGMLAGLNLPGRWLARASLGTRFALLGGGTLVGAALAAAAAWAASLPLAVAAGVLLIATVLGLARLGHRLQRQCRAAAGFLDNFSQGVFDGVIDASGHDAMAQAMLALKRVQTRVGFEFIDAKRRAVEVEAQRQAENLVTQEVAAVVSAATAGDLTGRIPLEGKNSFFQQLCGGVNALLDTVTHTFISVQALATELSAASEQVSQTSQSLAHSASQQAAGVEQTTASLHEISASVRQNADSATVTDGIATQAASQALEGGQAVGQGLGQLGHGHRAGLVAQLANLEPYPESVPINSLVRVPGTPLADSEPIDPFDFVRVIAVARITMPKARVRLSAGRQQMGEAVQALCFMAGANSIFYGDKLLVTGNPDVDADVQLLAKLGLNGHRTTTTEGDHALAA